MKSVFVNELLDSKEIYKDINNIIRDKIIKNKDTDIIKKDKKIKKNLWVRLLKIYPTIKDIGTMDITL